MALKMGSGNMLFHGVFDNFVGQFTFPIVLECVWMMFATMRFLDADRRKTLDRSQP